MPTLTTFIQHSIGSPSHSNQTRKIDKVNPNWTVEEMKQKETTAAKKQQELTACLSLDGYVGGSLKKGQGLFSRDGQDK